MNASPTLRAPRIGVILSAFVAVGLMLTSASCGGDDGNGTATPTAAGAPNSPAAQSGPGGITVTAGTISGQDKKMLLINVVPETGGAPVAEACIPITSDRFSPPATALNAVQAGQQAPCSGPAVKFKLPEGSYTITAGIYAPPAQAPEKQSRQTVQVKGDITVTIDGAALSN